MMPISAFPFQLLGGGKSTIKNLKKRTQRCENNTDRKSAKKVQTKEEKKTRTKKVHKKVPKKGNLKMAENNAFKSAKNSKLLSKVH